MCCVPGSGAPRISLISITSAGQRNRIGSEENPNPRLTTSQVPHDLCTPETKILGSES